MAAEAQQQIAFEEPPDFFEVGSEEPGLRIYLRYDLFRALDEYAVRDTSRELAALLVGQVHEGGQGGGNCIVVEDAIEVGVADEREGRFSPRVWQHARRVARTRYANKVIVGWYHTHPGTGLDLSQEEREVHKTFFPEAWQVMYVVDPVSRDRNFYRQQESRLGGVRGFRIFGKETSNFKEKPASAAPQAAPPAAQAKEEGLRERYLERSLEKIMRAQRRPPLRPVDLLIILLLLINLLAMMLRPAPVAKVDMSQVTGPMGRMSNEVNRIGKRVEALERHLKDLQVLDEQIAQPTPDASATPGMSSTPEVGIAPAEGSKEIHEHLVKEGDTLSLIAEKYYGPSGSSLVGALAKYNKLRGNEIFPGDTLKIPSRDHLP
ncbi:LysM peptidoglycan-binding domain-containing protein [bacterium]|nr:LysM peptidoglycan-binding domain-containing protein [bacterium]